MKTLIPRAMTQWPAKKYWKRKDEAEGEAAPGAVGRAGLLGAHGQEEDRNKSRLPNKRAEKPSLLVPQSRHLLVCLPAVLCSRLVFRAAVPDFAQSLSMDWVSERPGRQNCCISLTSVSEIGDTITKQYGFVFVTIEAGVLDHMFNSDFDVPSVSSGLPTEHS